MCLPRIYQVVSDTLFGYPISHFLLSSPRRDSLAGLLFSSCFFSSFFVISLQRYHLFLSYQNLLTIFFLIFKIINNNLCFFSAYFLAKSLNISLFYLFHCLKCLY